MAKSDKKIKKRRHRSPSSSESSETDSDESPRKKQRRAFDGSVMRRPSKASSSRSPSTSLDSSSTISSSSSDSEIERKKHKKHRKRERKSKHKKKLKKKEKKRKKEKKHKKRKKKKKTETDDLEKSSPVTCTIGPERKTPTGHTSGTGRLLKPMTKEEWEKQQSVLHRVYDPETGRNRLVRGDGEIVEEIVSKQRHQEINKLATVGDGIYYQMKSQLQK